MKQNKKEKLSLKEHYKRKDGISFIVGFLIFMTLFLITLFVLQRYKQTLGSGEITWISFVVALVSESNYRYLITET